MFDPYRKWLGIPQDQIPPTMYQLLGLGQGEADPDVIEEAAIRQTTHLRAYQIGPNAKECTRLLNEIAQAKQTLLNPAKRKAYDAQLAQKNNAAVKPGPPAVFTQLADDQPKPKKTPKSIRKKGSGSLLWVGIGGGVVGVVTLILVIVLLTRGPAKQDQPVAVVPVKPEPVKPDPGKPLVKPDPIKPDPVKPDPAKTVVIKPDPVKPNPLPAGVKYTIKPLLSEPLMKAGAGARYFLFPNGDQVLVRKDAKVPPELHSVRDWKQFKTLHYNSLQSPVAVLDNRYIALTRYTKGLDIWDTVDDKHFIKLPGLDGIASMVAVSKDGNLIAAYSSFSKTIVAWDWRAGKTLQSWKQASQNTAVGITFNAAQDAVLMMHQQEKAMVHYDIKTGESRVQEVVFPFANFANAFDVNADTSILAIRATDGNIYAAQLDPWKGLNKAELSRVATDNCALTRDGRIVIASQMSVGPPNQVSLFDTQSGKELCRSEQTFEGIKEVSLSNDGRIAGTVSADMLTLWEINAIGEVAVKPEPVKPNPVKPNPLPPGKLALKEIATGELMSNSGGVTRYFLFPNGEQMLFRPGPGISQPSEIRQIKDWKNDIRVMSYEQGSYPVGVLGNRYLALATNRPKQDHALMIWDSVENRLVQKLEGEHFMPNTFLTLNDGQRVAASGSKKVLLWDWKTGKILRSWQTDRSIAGIVHTPNPNLLVAFYHQDKIASELDILNGEIRPRPMNVIWNPTFVGQSADGKRCQFRTTSAAAYSFEIDPWREGAKMKLPPSHGANSVALSGDGRLSLPGVHSKLGKTPVVIYDAATGEELGRSLEEFSGTRDNQLSFDGRIAVTTSGPANMTVWQVGD